MDVPVNIYMQSIFIVLRKELRMILGVSRVMAQIPVASSSATLNEAEMGKQACFDKSILKFYLIFTRKQSRGRHNEP
jgi:hypothetical protein